MAKPGNVPKRVRLRARMPRELVCCDRVMAQIVFRMPVAADGTVSLETLGSHLALACMGRGRKPEEFEFLSVNGESDAAQAAAEAVASLMDDVRLAGVRLSRREQQVLNGINRGLANKEIGHRLHISERTVKFHTSSLLVKFRVRSRNDLPGASERRQVECMAAPPESAAASAASVN